MKRMLFLVIGSLVVAFISCRKEQPHELPANGETQPQHCFNYVQDGDETSVDCGGSCPACTFVTAPCTTTTNTIALTTFPTVVFSSGNITETLSGSEYEILAVNGSDFLTLTFNGAPNQVFTVVNGTPFNSGEISITYAISGFTFNGSSGGQVYINLVNGKYELDFCNVTMYTFQGGGLTRYMTGNITGN